MTIFGKKLSEYVRFQKGMLLLVAIVGLGRLGLSLAGVPNSTARWLSVTGALLLGSVVYAVRVPRTHFGGYRHLLPLVTIQNLLAQLIIIGGIVLAIMTGKDNIFSAPEFSGGGDGKTWFHAGAHLIFAGIVGSLVGWGITALLMLIVKKVAKGDEGSATATA